MALKDLLKKNEGTPLKFKRDRMSEDLLTPPNCRVYKYEHNNGTIYTITYYKKLMTYDLSRTYDKDFHMFSIFVGWKRSLGLEKSEYQFTDWDYVVNIVLMDIV